MSYKSVGYEVCDVCANDNSETFIRTTVLKRWEYSMSTKCFGSFLAEHERLLCSDCYRSSWFGDASHIRQCRDAPTTGGVLHFWIFRALRNSVDINSPIVQVLLHITASNAFLAINKCSHNWFIALKYCFMVYQKNGMVSSKVHWVLSAPPRSMSDSMVILDD